MKTILVATALLVTASAHAQVPCFVMDSCGQQSQSNYPREIQVTRPDPSPTTLRGELESDGNMRVRDWRTGEIMRGYVTNEGYGTLRNSKGDTYRVMPR